MSHIFPFQIFYLTTVLFFSQIINQRVIVRTSILFSILVNILIGPQIWHLMYDRLKMYTSDYALI